MPIRNTHEAANRHGEEFEEKLFEMETSPNIPCKKLFGVSFEELPPANKLTETQMQELIDAIEDTWSVFGIGACFPDEIPLQLKYELVKDTFLDDIHYMPGWQMTHDFCTGYCPDCKLKDYCENCIHDWANDESEMDITLKNDDELPF